MEQNQMPVPVPGMPMPSAPAPMPSQEDPAGSEDLNPPVHEERPVVSQSAPQVANEIAVKLAPKKGIEVVALRKAFYNQDRKHAGSRFFIKGPEDFGEWMKCIDPYWEKQRVEFYKQKKAK